jgi:translation initiation factor 1 (eIF-1/SUI1)
MILTTPSLSLGWNYSNLEPISLEEFENERSVQRLTSQSQLQLRRDIRELLLLEWGVPRHKIAQSVRATVKAKHQRRRTVSSIGTYDVFEEMMERTARKIKRTLHVGKTLSMSNTDQVNTEIERLAKSCSESKTNRSTTLALNKLAIDFPDTFTAPTTPSSSEACSLVDTDSEKEISSVTGPHISTTCIVEPKQHSLQQFDRAPMMPRRPVSPIPERSSSRRLMMKDSVSTTLDVSCTLSASDPHIDFPLSLSESETYDFDSSITTRETRDERNLMVSFSLVDANNQCPKNEDIVSLPGDDETTINTKFIKIIEKAANICTSVTDVLEKNHTTTLPIKDTKSNVNIISQPTTMISRQCSNARKHDLITNEYDDDETSIDSQLMDLLFGTSETIPQKKSEGTWPEIKQLIVSSKMQEGSMPRIDLNQSIGIKDKYSPNKDKGKVVLPPDYNEFVPVTVVAGANFGHPECTTGRLIGTAALSVSNSCSSTDNSNITGERTSECGTNTTSSTTKTCAIDNTNTKETNDSDDDKNNVFSNSTKGVIHVSSQRQRRRRYVPRPPNDATELIEV